MTQVDRRTGLVGNTGIKEPVKTTTTANITLSGEQTIDGISCVDGDRVLVKDQTTAANNGIYEVDTGTWSRTKDCDGAYDLKNGTLIFVRQGTTNGNKIFKCSATEPITIGTTSLSFTIVDIEFSGNVQTVWCGTADGTTDALTLTPSNAVTALTSGLTLLFKSGAANNTTAVTIAVSGLTATTAQLNGAAMVAGDIEANRWYMAVYEAGGTFQVSKIGIPALLHALTIDGAVTASGVWTHTNTVYWAKGADIVSAATLVLGTDGNMFDVTGSTGPITAITVPAGMLFMLQFDSTPTLTHHATNLNLPGGANITVAAGDRAVCFATAANQVDVISISNLATQAKQEAGTDQVSSVTPATQQYHQSAAKVWGYATMSAGAPTLEVSYNVTSLTDTATGQLTITIATDFSSANWSCVPSIGVTAGTFQRMVVYDPLAAGSVLIRCMDTAADRDPDSWGWSFYGDQ